MTMTLDLPEFVEELARAGAAAEYTDLTSYVALLIIRDDERRRAEAAQAAAKSALPAVPEGFRERALQKLQELRAKREACNLQDDSSRAHGETRKRAAGRTESLDDIAGNLGIGSPQPVRAEVQAPPGRNDPALQEAFDAFDRAKLPRPPLTKLTGLTPAEGLDTLRTLVKYLDATCDPVANVVRLVLSELRGQSFESFAGTKEWGKLVQCLADRMGYVIECPRVTSRRGSTRPPIHASPPA
jgi:hypothetical protein